MEDDLPDFLLEDDIEEETEEEIQAHWEKLIKTPVSGRSISISGRGGDMYRIDAIIVRFLRVVGYGILVEVECPTVSKEWEGDDSVPEQIDCKYLVLDLSEPPRFDGRILLPSGVTHWLSADGQEWSYGSGLDVGFIY